MYDAHILERTDTRRWSSAPRNFIQSLCHALSEFDITNAKGESPAQRRYHECDPQAANKRRCLALITMPRCHYRRRWITSLRSRRFTLSGQHACYPARSSAVTRVCQRVWYHRLASLGITLNAEKWSKIVRPSQEAIRPYFLLPALEGLSSLLSHLMASPLLSD